MNEKKPIPETAHSNPNLDGAAPRRKRGGIAFRTSGSVLENYRHQCHPRGYSCWRANASSHALVRWVMSFSAFAVRHKLLCRIFQSAV
jgi:hypothetical protein